MTESSLDDSREADWQGLVTEALKGASFGTLRSRTYDGLVIEPLYARATGANVIPGRLAGAAWTVMQRIDLPDPRPPTPKPSTI
jgi:methylmalonyl-CoA mutase